MIFKRMREQILDKAIRGQLVPQLQEEGVVEQIGDAPTEVPFELPASWKWGTLTSICSLITDGTHNSPKNSTTKDSVYKNLYITAKNIKDYGIDLSKPTYVNDKDHAEITKRCFPCFGDILFVKDGATTGVVTSNNLSEPFSMLSSVALIRTIPSFMDGKFLIYVLRSPHISTFIRTKMKGTGITRVTLNILKSIPIPIPPLAEQKRIAAKLESLLGEISRAEKAYEELQSLANVLRGQILQKAIQGKLVPQLAEDGVVNQIGDAPAEVPFDIPDSWKWLTLEAIGFWKAGATPSRSVKEYYENGTIPWLKTGDLTDGIISTVEEQITQDALDSCTAHINPKGSVLIAMYGATIGKLGVLDIDCATNQACCACQVNSSLIYNWYLFYYLMSQRANFIAQGAGGAQTNISKTKITVYPIPIPPLAEQKRIVAKVDTLFEQIDLMT